MIKALFSAARHNPVRLQVLLVAYVILLLAMAYAFAKYEETGQGQGFMAIPLWGALVAVAVASGTLAPVVGLLLLGLAWYAPEAARMLSLPLRPIASARFHGSLARDRESFDATGRDHQQRLTQAFTKRHRVLRASHGDLLLDGRFAVQLLGESIRDQQALVNLVGKGVGLRLPDEFLRRYIPSAQSGVTSEWPGVRSRGFGLIPVLVFDGSTLVNLTSAAPGSRPTLEAQQARYRAEMERLTDECQPL